MITRFPTSLSRWLFRWYLYRERESWQSKTNTIPIAHQWLHQKTSTWDCCIQPSIRRESSIEKGTCTALIPWHFTGPVTRLPKFVADEEEEAEDEGPSDRAVRSRTWSRRSTSTPDGRLLPARSAFNALGLLCTSHAKYKSTSRAPHQHRGCMPTPSCMEESFALVLPTEGSLAPPPVAGCT